MRKRVIALGLSLTLSLMTLVGCGIGGSHKSDDSVETGKNEVSTYCEPTEEIMAADFTDFKFQLDNTVFQIKGQTTVEELLNQFPSDEYVLTVYETSTGEYKEQATNKLVEAGGVENYFIVNKKFADSKDIHAGATWGIEIAAKNKSDSVSDLKDCIINGFEFNVVYAGTTYFAKGIPAFGDAIQSDERFSYDNISETFAGYGFETIDEDTYDILLADENQFAGRKVFIPGNDGLTFSAVTHDDLYKDNMVSPAVFWITFTIDPDTRMCSNIYYFYNYAVEGLDW